MANPVEIFFGEAAKEQFDGDDDIRRLNDIRAKKLRISTEQALATSRLLMDVYRSLQMGYDECGD